MKIKLSLILSALLIVSLLVVMGRAAQPKPGVLSESERIGIYAKFLERENLLLQIQPLQLQLDQRTRELDDMVNKVYQSRGVKREEFDLNPLTGEFLTPEKKPDQTPKLNLPIAPIESKESDLKSELKTELKGTKTNVH